MLGVQKEIPQLVIPNQIPYKFKCAMEYFPPKGFSSQEFLLVLHSSIITSAEKENFRIFLDLYTDLVTNQEGVNVSLSCAPIICRTLPRLSMVRSRLDYLL